MDKSIKKNESAMWIFACYDNDRVSAMSMFSNTAHYFSEEHAIDTVRSRFSINKNQIVNFVKPHIWNAPNAVATPTSFDIDMQKVNSSILKYLESFNYQSSDVLNALNVSSAIPNPKLGILLICVDLRFPETSPMPVRPVPTPATPFQSTPQPTPVRIAASNKSPFLAALLSYFLLGGAGQIYLGQWKKGLALMISTFFLSFVFIGIFIQIIGIGDAYGIAQKMSTGNSVGEWEFNINWKAIGIAMILYTIAICGITALIFAISLQ